MVFGWAAIKLMSFVFVSKCTNSETQDAMKTPCLGYQSPRNNVACFLPYSVSVTHVYVPMTTRSLQEASVYSVSV